MSEEKQEFHRTPWLKPWELSGKLLIFIDHILNLPENEEIELNHQLKPLFEREELKMGLSLDDTSFAKYYKRLGMEEGRAEGKVEGKAEGEKQKTIEIVKNLLALGISIESICKATDLTKDEVNRIIEAK
jgi:predicted transposase/invertase (TIGR01784 family)